MNKKFIKKELESLNNGEQIEFKDRKEKNRKIIVDYYEYTYTKPKAVFTTKKLIALCSSLVCIMICLLVGFSTLSPHQTIYLDDNFVITSSSVEELTDKNDLIHFKENILDYTFSNSSLYYDENTNKTLVIVANYINGNNKLQINYITNEDYKKNIRNYAMYEELESKKPIRDGVVVAEYSTNKDAIYMKVNKKGKTIMMYFAKDTVQGALNILDEILK